MRPRLVLLGALLVTTALLAACSPSSSTGPLGDGGTPGQQCMPFAEGRPVTVGIFDLTNTGSSPVTIHGVRLGSPRGLTMTEAWLVPIEHFATYVSDVGAGAPFPPNDSPSGRWAWAHRRPAVGAVLRKHQDLNLVFGVIRTTARAGRSAGPVIVYSVSGGTYTVQEQTSLVVAAASC